MVQIYRVNLIHPKLEREASSPSGALGQVEQDFVVYCRHQLFNLLLELREQIIQAPFRG